MTKATLRKESIYFGACLQFQSQPTIIMPKAMTACMAMEQQLRATTLSTGIERQTQRPTIRQTDRDKQTGPLMGHLLILLIVSKSSTSWRLSIQIYSGGHSYLNYPCFVCMYICAPHTCLVSTAAIQGNQISCKWNYTPLRMLLCGCWISNLCPLDELPVILTAVSTFQPQL